MAEAEMRSEVVEVIHSSHKGASHVIEIADDDEDDESVVAVIDSSFNSESEPVTPLKGRLKSKRLARQYRKRNTASSDSDDDCVIDRVIRRKKKNIKPEERRRSRRGKAATSVIETPATDENDNAGARAIQNEDTPTMVVRGRKTRESLSNGNHSPEKAQTEEELVAEGVVCVENFFNDSMCRKIEKKLDEMCEKAKCGLYKQKTYDRAPLRNKYFFGEGYTYGKQMAHKGPGQERLHRKGDVDEIPKWISKHIISRVVEENIVPEGWINSCVINEYFPGGCIVSHVDPIHIFDRPIISINFNSSTYLCFGVKFSFNPIRTTEPVHAVPIHRGQLTAISGYAADSITHCIRPQDITQRRCVMILRRVFPDAPRVGDEDLLPTPYNYRMNQHQHYHKRSHTYEPITRKRSRRIMDRSYHDDSDENGRILKKRKSRHSL